jgi:UDP-N-acetylglucosamine 2-epimerase (non-hydrolysing)
LGLIAKQLMATADVLPLVFPVHPRTKNKLKEFGLYDSLNAHPGVKLTDPLGYIEFMNLVVGASAVITDSGGVQEETTYLRIPCLTLRENTERPITLTQGSNRLGAAPEIKTSILGVLEGRWQTNPPPANWDGHAAARCVAALRRRIGISS